MDALLPSEIARLVLGYLQEQKCEEAAKMFLETSPVLQECRIVAQRGGRYSTKVGGLCLTDILDKYCAANAMVQEKLNKASDCEQLKQCNDLLEQLRYLLEGSRGHRFVVNISVPSQSSPSGSFGSPVLSNSTRKRHNSERGKRASRSLNSLIEKSTQCTVTQNCDTVEATPLESLPGHKISTKQINIQNHANTVSDKSLNKTESTSNTPKESKCNTSTTVNMHLDPNSLVQNSNTVNSNRKDQSTETVEQSDLEQIKTKCSAVTSTEELMSYCSTEVQTGPCDLIESESDVNDEPIENLGILTKELLQRTELHERIAENINKAILPVETSFREENTCENATEANISLLTDFDNAIKSVVEATETDPVFEGFLHEIFKIGETDTSPDEDSDAKQNQRSNSKIDTQDNEPMEIDNNELIEPVEPVESKINDKECSGPEVPLKHRLRSSSKSQNLNIEEEEKESNSLLENQNAEAVMNIVNVIANKRNSLINNELNTEKVPNEEVPKTTATNEPLTNVKLEPEKKIDENKVVKPTKKSSNKKPKTIKQDTLTNSIPIIPEEDIDTIPTLILCSEKEMEPLKTKISARNGFIPIAPKVNDTSAPLKAEPPSKIYLRTVNVPCHLMKPQYEATKTANPVLLQLQKQVHPQKSTILNATPSNPVVLPLIFADDKSIAPAPTESITLYAGESNSTEVNVSPIASMPVISFDESAIGLTAGTGLSPFFKENCNVDLIEETKHDSKKDKEQPLVESIKDVPKVIEDTNTNININSNANCLEPSLVAKLIESKEKEKKNEEKEKIIENKDKKEDEKQNEEETTKMEITKDNESIISKRTPKTLLKSRSKNNRLSLSTPRRRNSHVRALDFNTPMKFSGTPRNIPQSCTRSRSVCRAGLFKSPPFSSDAAMISEKSILDNKPIKKVKTITPVKQSSIYLQVPIATRSPAPKLQGNWNKVTGIGMILGDTSTSESSPEKSQSDCSQSFSSIAKINKQEVNTKVVEKKSWDTDLRKIIGTDVSEEDESSKPKRTKKAIGKRKTDSATKTLTTSKEKVKEKSKASNELRMPDNSDNGDKTDNDEKDSHDIKSNNNAAVKECNNEESECIPSIVTISKNAAEESKENKKVNGEDEKKEKTPSLSKISPETLGPISRLSHLLELETPRKTEVSLYIPPTPRLYTTPGNSLIKLNRSKTDQDMRFKDFVDTPEFPVTPCIVVTPKIVEEEDNDKKPSPYYEPEEVAQTVKQKEIINTEKALIQETTSTLSIQRNVVELQENKVVEITKLGVIEKNIASEEKEEAVIAEENLKENIDEENADTSINSDSDSDNESTDSNSSTSSSSSDSSSSSSSSCSSTVSTPTKITENNAESQNNGEPIVGSKLESPKKLLQNFTTVSQDDLNKVKNEIERNESSPSKVFAILKEDLDMSIKETPIKTESNTIPEAEISETPSVSNAERALRRDSITNLTSKISAIITTSQSDQRTTATSTITKVQKSEITCDVSSSDKTSDNTGIKPKILSIKNIAPVDGMAIQVSKLLQSNMQKHSVSSIQQQQLKQPQPQQKPQQLQQQQQVSNNIKLSQQLEEKRLRVMAKFKAASNNKATSLPKKIGDEAKQKKFLAMKKNAETEKMVSSTTTELTQNVESQLIAKKETVKKIKGKTTVENKKDTENRKELKKNRTKSPKKKTVQKQDQNIKTENKEEVNVKKVEKETIQVTAKETTVVSISAENSKGISKAKVDQVRRDLFSDEEMNDQRTTRSQSARRTVDSQKSNEGNDIVASVDSPKEKLPGVLECLQLIPASKSDQESHDLNNISLNNDLNVSQTNIADITIVYDESVPIKKRKRKYSNSELNNEYTISFPDAVHTLHLTAYDELFKLAPKNNKKVKSPKKSPVKIKKSKAFEKTLHLPLATSSPLMKAPSIKSGKSSLDDKRRKSCKRKPSPIKEETQIEKKSKPDPQTLFNRIKIDEFLKSVHVPE